MKRAAGWWIPDSDSHHESFLNSGPQVAGRGTYQYQKFERALKHVKQRRHAIDIGAHVGFWSWHMSRAFERIDAFEPMPQHLECYRPNMVGVENVTLHTCALANMEGTLPFYWNPHDTGAAHVVAEKEPVEPTNRIPVRKLDAYNFENVDFIKIDVEGFEQPTILGAKETILTNKPVIIIEQKPNGNAERYGRHRFAALDELRSWGGVVAWEMGGDFLVEWR
jgi:FkbM family methyltransferase